MKVTADSHLDHGLTDAHRTWLLEHFGNRAAFFIETVQVPDHLPPVTCGLYGPLMGDAPVRDAECRSEVRGGRAGESRVCDRAPRLTRTLTVIGGPHEAEPCILYTAFGGPPAPREPWDPSLDDAGRAHARVFWAQHALSAP